jgi:hypothetical protein
MPARTTFEVLSEIPTSRGGRTFADFLIAGWGHLREEPVGPLERVGIGFQWFTRAKEGSLQSTPPRPWGFILRGLVERGAISPKAKVYMLRSECVHISKSGERPRLLVTLER